MADGTVIIKVKTEDKSLNDLNKALRQLRNSFQSLRGVDPFKDISSSAKKSADSLTGVGKSSNKVKKELVGIDGKPLKSVSTDADKAGKSLGDTAKGADKASSSMDKGAGSGKKFSLSLKDIAKSAVAVKAVSMAFDVLKASIGDAVKRFDTLKTYPRTMQMLGFSTEQVDRSTRKLTRGIEGLPTKLDDVVVNAKRLAGVTGNLDEATDTTLALNNAFLASGSSSADAARGTEQYIQMLSNGVPDMHSWRTLQETMNVGLQKAAESFGFTGPSALNQFYNALKSGKITFQDFNKRMIELDNATGGFADMAKENSKGIATSFENLKTAVVRNVANMIEKFDDFLRKVTGLGIAEHIDNAKGIIDSAFKVMGVAIDLVTPLFVGLANVVKAMSPIFEALIPTLAGVVARFVAFKVVTKITAMWAALTKAVNIARQAYHAYSVTMVMMNTGIVSSTAVTKGLTAALATIPASAGVATKAIVLFKGATTALSGPVGWIVGAVGLLAGGFVALKQTIWKTSEETQEFIDNLDATAEASSSLSDSVDQSTEAYKTQQKQTQANQDSIQMLVDDIIELSEKEQKSAADKKMLKDAISQVNEQVEGLALAYDEESGALSMGNEALQQRVDLYGEEQKLADAQERMNEIQRERSEIEQQLEEIVRQTSEAEKEAAEATFLDRRKIKESVAENKEEYEKLQERLVALGEQEAITHDQIVESSGIVAEATEAGVQSTIHSLDQLEGKQREVAEQIVSEYNKLEEAATNMFDTIQQKSALSVEEMNNNLLENREAVAQWSENIKELANRGVDMGIIEELRKMGPEGALQTQALVDATDAELQVLSENFRINGEKTKEGFLDSTALDDGETIRGIENFAFNSKETFIEAVRSSGLVDVVPEEFSNSAEKMNQAGQDIGQGLAQGIDNSKDVVGTAATGLGDRVNTDFSQVLGIQSPSTVFIGHGRDITTGLSQGINNGSSGVLTAVRNLANKMNSTMSQQISSMTRGASSGLRQMTNSFTQEFNRSAQSVSNGTNRIVREFNRLKTHSTQSTKQMWNAVTNDTRNGTNKVKSTTQQGFEQVRNVIRQKMEASKRTVSSNMSAIVREMNSKAQSARSAGRNFGMGFYYGLSSTRGQIVAMARSIADSASRTIKSGLRIKSPSRVSMEYGSFFGQGLWLGMEKEESNIKRTAEKMANWTKLDFGRVKWPYGVSGSNGVLGTNSRNNNITVNVTGQGEELQSREFYERVAREIAWYAN